METGNLLTGLALLACAALPIYFVNRKRNKHAAAMKALLEVMASKHQSKIAEHSTGRNFAIGIGSDGDRVYFYRETDRGGFTQEANLKEIQSISLIREQRTVQMASSSAIVIDRAGIRLDFRKYGGHLEFDFYRSDKLDTLGDELVLANEWVERLRTIMN